MYARLCRDDGVALIAALMAMMLMLVLCTALTMMTITETKITENQREGIEALYAADAGVELAISDLRQVLDWSEVLSGAATSTFAEDPADGGPRSADGAPINLGNERPSGADGRGWRLYVYGALANMLPATSVDPRIYLLVWVGEPPVADQGALILRARAYGPLDARRTVEVTVKRMTAIDPAAPGATIQRLSWRER
jgi:hypothetical protein